jgi:hypothetical protein
VGNIWENDGKAVGYTGHITENYFINLLSGGTIMDTTLLFFIVIIISQAINAALLITVLGRESESASDNARAVLDTYYQYYTSLGY